MSDYRELHLYIDGRFHDGTGRHSQPVFNPADGTRLGDLPHASRDDLATAVASASVAFRRWKLESPLVRSDILRRAAALLRERSESIARDITLDQGKPLAEARGEVAGCAEQFEWHAEEGRRIYGRVIPARTPAVRQIVLREPVGVCAAFTPWNFPLSQAVRKVAAALASGCTIVIKGPEDSPSAVVAMAQVLHDAGLPPGCLNVVWGAPAEVSQFLVEAPEVRKISFTGSVAVGKQLAALAGRHMKRSTMELGGHSPVIVCGDADVERAADLLAPFKFRNAGQVCVSPTRFYVHESVRDRFLDRFLGIVRGLRVGPGLDASTQMGPLAHERRVTDIAAFVNDARERGASIETGGGTSLQRHGFFHAPTVVIEPPADSRLMTEEPFGPVAAVASWREVDEVLARANSLPFGLASYVFTTSSRNAHVLSTGLEAGMVNINHFGMGPAEVPFGGVKDSGYGSEGGTETFDGYLNTKLVTQLD